MSALSGWLAEGKGGPECGGFWMGFWRTVPGSESRRVFFYVYCFWSCSLGTI